MNRRDVKSAELAKSRVFWFQNNKKKLCALCGLCVSAFLLWPDVVRADPYGDPPVKRQGFALGAALGPSVFKGAGGMNELQGVGGSLDLRVGTSAAENLMWLIELVAGGYLVEVNDADGIDQTYNAMTTVTFGGQLYIREALWLRGGLGLAGFVERKGRSGPVDEDSQRAGLGVIGGGGYDFFRRSHLALSLEVCNTIGAFRSGLLGQTSVVLGLAWY